MTRTSSGAKAGRSEHGIEVYVVKEEIFRYGRKETGFDFEVFSGLALRGGKEQWPANETAWVESQNPNPLQLIHSGLVHPRVMKPSSNLVVIDEVARKLEALPNVKLLQIEFLKVVAVPMFDKRQEKREVYMDYDSFFKSLPDDARLRAEMPKYYEVLAARLHTIWDRYEATEIEYEFSVPKERIKICAKMFDDYPVINRSGVLLAPQIADIIVPELDKRFFVVKKLWVPN
jgi:hypothetical protein